jgi:hypothetical protein
MDNSWTCGQGLAATAPLPAALGTVTKAIGANLELHLEVLDAADPASRREREVYVALAGELSDAATLLAQAAARMAAARALPMAPHDEQAMADPRMREEFRTLTDAEHDLAVLLETRLPEDRKMLDAMGRD